MLTRFMALVGLGDTLSSLVLGVGVDPLMVMADMAAIYLVLEMFLDPIGIMLLTLPVVERIDVNLIWFGAMAAKYLEIAPITPPSD